MATNFVYPRGGQDYSNFLSGICPVCGYIHKLYNSGPYNCANNGWPVTNVGPLTLVADDLPSGDYLAVSFLTATFAAIGKGSLSTGAGNVSWTQQQNKLPPGMYWNDIISGNSLYLALGWDQWGNGVVATSPDALTWTLQSLPAGTGKLTTGMWNGSNLFVLAGPNLCITSPNGTTWTARTVPIGSWTAINWNGSNLYLMIDKNGLTATSANGTTGWAYATVLPAPCNEMVFGATLFACFGTSVLYTSTNGVAWTSRSIAAGTYNDGVFDGTNALIVGNGVAATSTDMITWTPQTIGAGNWQSVISNATTLYVVTGYGSVAKSSTDRAAWTARTITGGYEVLRAGKLVES